MKGQILLSGEGLGELSNSLERRNVGQTPFLPFSPTGEPGPRLEQN